MKNLMILIFVLLSLSISGCIKQRDVNQFPNDLVFAIRKNGEKLNTDVLNSMKLYYLKQGSKIYSFDRANVPSLELLDESLGVQKIPFPIGIESGNGTKSYYLEYPNGEVDNVYVDYQKLDHDQAVKDPCYCYFKLIEIKYNGVRVSYDPAIKNSYSVYRFDKLN